MRTVHMMELDAAAARKRTSHAKLRQLELNGGGKGLSDAVTVALRQHQSVPPSSLFIDW